MILIIEDDPVWQLKIQMLLAKMKCTDYKLATTIGEVQNLISPQLPDLIVADIILSGESVFDHLNELFSNIPTIFITSYAEVNHLKQSISFPKSSFLVKPFNLLTLQAALEIQLAAINKVAKVESPTIRIRGNYGKAIMLSLNLIHYIKADGNYITLYSGEKRYMIKSSLKKFSARLTNDFVQIHKSFIINKHLLTRVDIANNQVFINKTAIPIGRNFRSVLLDNLVE